MNYSFLMPGDKLKSKDENHHFHRDFIYEVSHRFSTLEGNLILVTDKNGNPTPLNMYYFEYAGKTASLIEERIKRARIEFWWNNYEYSELEIFHNWDRTDPKDVKRISSYYGLSKAVFGNHPGAIACITFKNRSGEESRQMIYEKEEAFKFMFKHASDVEWDYQVHLKGISSRVQEGIDKLTWDNMNSITSISEPFKDEVMEKFKGYYWSVDHNWTFEQLKRNVFELIFDSTNTRHEGFNEVLRDVMILYRDLLTSHSATSVSKILKGKSKVNNKNVEHLNGKYKNNNDIKQPQLFEFASIVESWLYGCEIFATKEDYSSGKEWRGNFEFIGSKYINKEELDKLINS